MIERFPKRVLASGVVCAVLLAVYIAYSRPWYFNNQTSLVGLLALEFLVVAVWMYRRVFLPVVILTFLFAGMRLPVGEGGFSMGRWIVLGVGAFVGLLIVLRDRSVAFRSLHLLASFAVAAFFVSVTVSNYQTYTLLKACSMLLLFVYASTGARIAVAGHENRFFTEFLLGIEAFAGLVALLYCFGINVMGNPNSLGGVVCLCAPVLLWAVLLGGKPSVQGRRLILYVLCMYVVFGSRARASIGAALISSGLLCLALRRYKLFIEGAVAFAVLLSAASLFLPEMVPSFLSSVVYKKDSGVLFASRQSPWQLSFDNIADHPWFGTGLGTTGNEGAEGLGMFSSNVGASTERGSSFLSLLTGVGILGALPSLLMLLAISYKIARVIRWMWTTRSAFHPAIPLAMVIIAGLFNAVFEDWMFAVGNYMCVIFWIFAFILADVAPAPPTPVDPSLYRQKRSAFMAT